MNQMWCKRFFAAFGITLLLLGSLFGFYQVCALGESRTGVDGIYRKTVDVIEQLYAEKTMLSWHQTTNLKQTEAEESLWNVALNLFCS
jgi:hypothetical protein